MSTPFFDTVLYDESNKPNTEGIAFDMDAFLDQKMIRDIAAYADEKRKVMDSEIEKGLWLPAGEKLTAGVFVRHRGSLWRKE